MKRLIDPNINAPECFACHYPVPKHLLIERKVDQITYLICPLCKGSDVADFILGSLNQQKAHNCFCANAILDQMGAFDDIK